MPLLKPDKTFPSSSRVVCIDLPYLKVTVSCRIIQNKVYLHLPIYNLAEKEKLSI